MPKRYEAIKSSLRSQHPNWPESEIKKHAAMIYNGTRKKGEPSLSAHMKKEKGG